MSSRESILRAIRRHEPPLVERPSLDGPWIEYADPRQKFAEVLASIGGRCISVEGLGELNSKLRGIPAYAEAKRICSAVAGVGDSTLDLAAIDDPHDLADVDFAILPGQLAVAENGAVWITEEGIRHRVVYFLSQHLALVVPAAAVVSNMHEAYRRLLHDANGTPYAFRSGFGAFISGPSKTADIEQALVIGAHGARSLTVFLLDQQDGAQGEN